jgi:hypothetical protein
MTGQTYEAHHEDEGKVVSVPVDNRGEPPSAMRGAYSLDSGREGPERLEARRANFAMRRRVHEELEHRRRSKASDAVIG